METSHIDTSARDSVLSAIAWFDVFGYPLTAVEAARYSTLFGPSSVSLDETIRLLTDEGQINQQDGYYYIEGGESSTELRKRRFRLAGPKFKRARLVARLFGLLPSVRLVAVCNSLAVANAEEDSDIDLFVVCRPGTLWLTRLVLAAPLIVLRLRPTPTDQKNKICLSFFLSENALDLTRLHLAGDDPYMRFWTATLLPLYIDNVDNARQYLPQVPTGNKRSSIVCLYLPQKRTGIGRFEKLAKRLQMKQFPESIRSMANLDSRVLISDDILKFHVNDRREQYRDRFRERLDSLGVQV